MRYRYRNQMGQHLKLAWMGRKPTNKDLMDRVWVRLHWNDLTINGDGHVYV